MITSKCKFILIKFLMIFLVIFISGCTGSKATSKNIFDDNKIKVKVDRIQTINKDKSYSFTLVNEGRFTLKHVSLFLSYPIVNGSSSQWNPFKLELTPNSSNPELVKPGQKVKFNGYAPLGRAFTGKESLDFENPDLYLNGYVVNGNDEVIFTKIAPAKDFNL